MSSSNTGSPRIGGKFDPRKTWRLILLIIVYLAVLIINGLDEFLRSGFDLNLVFTPEWWWSVFRALFSNFLIFIGTFMYLLDLAVRKREDLVEKRKQVDNCADKHIDPVTFDPFHIQFERERKKNFYIRSKEAELEKLENKATMEDIELWDKHRKIDQDNPSEEDLKTIKAFKKNKFCFKKTNILKQLDKDFIEERIGYMKVKYRPISKSFVTSGYNRPSVKFDEYAVEPARSKLLWDLFPKFAIMAGVLIATESIFVEFAVTDSMVEAWFGMIFKVLPLMLQVYFAFSYCETYINEKIMVDLRKRMDIITLYVASLKKGAEKNA